MTYQELVARVARKHHLTKKGTREVLDGAFLELAAAAARGRVSVPHFGVFRPRVRKARRSTHPGTHEPMQLPASHTVGFRAAKELRALATVAAAVARRRAAREGRAA